MPHYMLTIYRDEAAAAQVDPSEVSAHYLRFMQRHAAALRGGAALGPGSTGRSVRPDGSGGHAITDGPFAETKEVLGGYYVVEAADLEEAVSIAREVPAHHGGVEVRPIRIMS